VRTTSLNPAIPTIFQQSIGNSLTIERRGMASRAIADGSVLRQRATNSCAQQEACMNIHIRPRLTLGGIVATALAIVAASVGIAKRHHYYVTAND